MERKSCDVCVAGTLSTTTSFVSLVCTWCSHLDVSSSACDKSGPSPLQQPLFALCIEAYRQRWPSIPSKCSPPFLAHFYCVVDPQVICPSSVFVSWIIFVAHTHTPIHCPGGTYLMNKLWNTHSCLALFVYTEADGKPQQWRGVRLWQRT